MSEQRKNAQNIKLLLMKTLKEYIVEASKNGTAIGHFNISNLETLWGIFNASRKLNLPVIIGVAEGERDFIGIKQVVALIKSLREEFSYPIFLNADHTYSFDRVKEAIDAGFDAVIFDGAKLPFEENIALTKKCVDYARTIDREILIEGEMGYIGGSSKVLDEIPEGVKLDPKFLTSDSDAQKFVHETGVDLFAPAVGNIHGMLKGGIDPSLNIERIVEIRKSANIPLVLHGASGNSPEDVRLAIKAGMSIVHINTEIRVAYKRGLIQSLQDNPEEVAPYKILKGATLEVEKVVTEKLKLFSNIE